jgi:hypothetical protein
VDAINHQEFWGRIPPEEKLLILHQAQAGGAMSAAVLVLAASGIAIGFQSPWIFWGSLIISPVVYKTISKGRFNKYRSNLMLLYLAARAAVRRYAYKYNAADLNVLLLFRGMLVKGTETSPYNEREEVASPLEVWIALFHDTIVVIGEAVGGARLYLAHNLEPGLTVHGQSPEGEGDYSRSRVVTLRSERYASFYRLTSDTPGALVVFEKKLAAILREPRYSHRQK